MKNKCLAREEVLLAISEQLADTFLKDTFPGYAPKHLREVIAGNRTEIKKEPSPVSEQNMAKPASVKKSTAINCTLFTDGASRGNPGKAGAGAVLFNSSGEELIASSSYLGVCTNNVAEYQALILGLEQAAQLGCSTINIRLDSELIVRQIQGVYKVKNATLKPLFARVQELLRNFGNWSIAHVPRAENSRADELANRGIDEAKH